MSPLYIIPSLPGSLRAFLSCSLMQRKYAFLSEKASRPKKLCGSCAIMFAMHFGSLQMAF